MKAIKFPVHYVHFLSISLSIMKPVSAATAPSNPMHTEVARRTMDQAANSVVKYHGGWCIDAARRKLERSNDPEDLLRIIPKFGTDLMVTANVKDGDEHTAADSSNSDDDGSADNSSSFKRHVFDLNDTALPFSSGCILIVRLALHAAGDREGCAH